MAGATLQCGLGARDQTQCKENTPPPLYYHSGQAFLFFVLVHKYLSFSLQNLPFYIEKELPWD